MDEVDTCTGVAEEYAKYIHAKEKEGIVLLTFLSVVCNMSQGVCCSGVIHTETTIKYRSSFVSWDVFGCIFKITIAFWFAILNAWKQGDSELDHFFGPWPVIHAPVPACIGSSVHKVQQSHSSLTKQISVLFCMSVQFQ